MTLTQLHCSKCSESICLVSSCGGYISRPRRISKCKNYPHYRFICGHEGKSALDAIAGFPYLTEGVVGPVKELK